jgi:hypothetical protein
MKAKKLPPVELLRERLSYNPETGELVWKTHLHQKRVGVRADYATLNGYRKLAIGGDQYYAHRIIWKLTTGEDVGEDIVIDHINNDPRDNRIVNLRAVSRSANTHNTRGKNLLDAPIKVAGIHKVREGKWRAIIFNNGKQIYLGLYDTVEGAITARLKAEAELKQR